MKEKLEKLKRIAIVSLIAIIILAIFVVPAIAISIVAGAQFVAPNPTSALPITSNLKFGITHPFQTIGILKSTPASFAVYIKSVRILLYIMIVFALFMLFKKEEEVDPWENKEHASSRWSKDGEQYSILSKTDGILLAKDNYLPVDKPGNINVMVVGGSGTGKSAAFVRPNVIPLLGSYVFTDPKGELYDDTAGYFEANGYEIKVLNLMNPNKSDGFNPLMNIRDVDDDLDIVTGTIFEGQGGPTGGDQYWDQMAERMLKALILFLIEGRPVEERNLASCANLVRLANNNGSFNIVSDLMKVLPDGSRARKSYEDVQIATDKAYSSILSTLQSKLGKFDSPAIAALTATNTIEFKDIAEKKTALYVISPDSHSTYNFLLTIFYSQMIQQLYYYADNNGGELKIPLYFFLDEFANIGQIPDFDKKISTSRSRKINFNVIVQNLDQLEAIYPDSFETILANCDTHLYLGSNSQKTSEYFSKALGEVNIVQESISVSTSKNTKGDEKGGTNESVSKNKFSRPLMTPDELKRLPKENCIILEKGLFPIFAEKAFYSSDPKSKELMKYKANHNEYEVDRGPWREFDINRKGNASQKNERLEKTLEKFDDKEKDILGMNTEKKNTVESLGIEDLLNPKPKKGIADIQVDKEEKKKEIKKDSKIKPIVFEEESFEENNNNNLNNKKIIKTRNREVGNYVPPRGTIDDLLEEDIDFGSEENSVENIQKKKENEIDPRKNLDFDVAREIEKKFDELFGFLDFSNDNREKE